ncbi:MAG: hypothetical protein AAGA54_23085 [Myxococcota bacterium]
MFSLTGIIFALATLEPSSAADDLDFHDELDDVAQPSTAADPTPIEGFRAYPYVHGKRDYGVRGASEAERETQLQPAAFRIGAEGAYLYGDAWRVGADLRVLLPNFYIEARYRRVVEGPSARLDIDVEVEGEVRNRRHLSTFGLGLQGVVDGWMFGRIGPTFSVMTEQQRPVMGKPTMEPGIGAALEVDLYPVKPLVVSARGSAIRFPDEVMLEARATVGVAIDRAEVFVGYDRTALGRVYGGGPMLGLNLRF